MKQDSVVTDEELKDRASALATTCEEITNLKLEQKEVNADFKERINALEKERARLARVVRTRLEEHDVEPPLLTLQSEQTASSE